LCRRGRRPSIHDSNRRWRGRWFDGCGDGGTIATHEPRRLGLALSGAQRAKSWTGGGDAADFYDLKGTVETESAEIGVLITLGEATRGMIEAANRSGNYVWPVSGQSYPKVQLATVRELLQGKRLNMPPPLTPYLTARRAGPR